MSVEEWLAGVRAETIWTDEQIRKWFVSRYPDPTAAWQPNIADVIAQISQHIYDTTSSKRRLEWPEWMK